MTTRDPERFHGDGRARTTICSRREFMAAAGVTALAATAVGQATAAATGTYRVAVIGHTGRGDYGHGLDRVWQDIPQAEVVAVADADPRGLAAAVERLGGAKGFADYRQMLQQTKPDLVSVAPRWLDQHRDMVIAAADQGVRGIYLEKPLCRTLAEADEMVAACRSNNVKLAIAHQTRYSPKMWIVQEMIRSGMLGRILEFRARGKDDHRGGGEDLWVLGTHVLDLMHWLGGRPRSCSGTVLQEGQAAGPPAVVQGSEGIGPLAGDEVHATYLLRGGAVGYFDSVRNGNGNPSRFGLRIFGTKGLLELHNTGYLPDVRLLADSSWSPGRTGTKWQPVSSAGVDQPEPIGDGSLHAGNVAAVKDLIAAIEADRQPLANIEEALATTEMIVAVFASHQAGGPVLLPLGNRANPLTMP